MNYTYLVDIIIQWPISRHEIHSNGQLFFFLSFFPSPQQTLCHIRGLSNKFSVTIDLCHRNDFDSTVDSMDDAPWVGPQMREEKKGKGNIVRHNKLYRCTTNRPRSVPKIL